MKKHLFGLFFICLAAALHGQTFSFECYGGYLTGADCQICTGQTTARLFNGLLIRQGANVYRLIDCPYYIRQQGNNLIITELIPNPESVTINLVSSGFSTIAGFKDSIACMCARQDSSWIGGGSGDNWGTQVVQRDSSLQGNGTTANPLGIKGYGAATNGQVPSKSAGGITWIDPASGTTNLSYTGASSPVTLNSSTGTDVTITAGTGISLSATGTDLTINNTGDLSATNEAWTADADAGDTEVISNQTVLFSGAGINTTNYDAGTNTLTVTGTEVDGSITNEGILGVGAGGANTSVVTSNTSTAAGVTVSGSNTILVTESTSANGGTITLQADTSLIATINDINIARNRDDSTFARLPGELYHTKRITSNAYRYGTTGFRTMDTVGVVNILTKIASKPGLFLEGSTSAGYMFLQAKATGYADLSNLAPFILSGQHYAGVNLPYSSRPNYVWNFGYNWDTNATNYTDNEQAVGFGFETYYQNASLSGGSTGFSEFHVRTRDTVTQTEHRFISAVEPWDAARGKAQLRFTTDLLAFSDHSTAGVWSHSPITNFWDFVDTVSYRYGEPRGFALSVLNGAGAAYMNTFSFNNTDALEIGRQNMPEVRISPPTVIGLSVTPARTLEVRGETRITDLTTDTPTRIVGADADGDLNAVTPSAEFTLSGSALNIAQQGASTGQALTWNGSTWSPSTVGSGTVTGTGANDQVAIWTSATNLEGDADFQWDGNKIKISGVAAGQQDVIQITNTNAGTNDQTHIRLWNDSGQGTTDGLIIGTASSGRSAPYTNMGFMWNYENGPLAFAMNNNEKMRVTGNGLIIGSTANAANKLDVEGAAVIGATYSGATAASANGLLVEGNVGIGNTSAQRKLHVTGEARITDLVTDVPTVIVGADADGDLATVTPGNGLTIDGSGNLNMPAGTIHQTMRHTGTAWAASSEILNDDAAVGVGGSPISGFELYVNGAQRNDGAYVTRGAGSDYTSNLAAPHVRIWNTTVTTGDTWYLASLNNGDLAFASSNLGGVQMLIENGTGDVGIGNAAPTQKLHVTGSARVTGAYYDSNNEPGTSGQVLSSTVTGTDWISAGSGTLNAANNGLYVSGTTVRLGTNPLIEATLIDQDANDMRFYDGKWSYSSRSVSWTPTQGFGLVGTEGSPTTASTPTQDGIAEFSVMNTGNALQSNSLTVGAYATDSEGFWIQSRSNSVPNVPYPLTTQPRGGQFSVGRLSGLDALVTLSATGLAGSTASGSVLHLENVEGNQKAAMTFGVAAGTDVTDGEIAYFDASDIVRVTNRNTTTGTSSFRIAVGGETSDRVTVVASSTTPSARMGVGTTSPTSTLQSAGSFARPFITTASATTLDERHSGIAYTGSGNVTFTLPTASSFSGREYIVAHNGSGGTLTFSTTITKGNASTFNTLTAGQWAWFRSDGTIWRGFKVASL